MHFGVGVTSPYIFNYYFMSFIFNLMFTEDIFRLTHDITIKNGARERVRKIQAQTGVGQREKDRSTDRSGREREGGRQGGRERKIETQTGVGRERNTGWERER